MRMYAIAGRFPTRITGAKSRPTPMPITILKPDASGSLVPVLVLSVPYSKTKPR